MNFNLQTLMFTSRPVFVFFFSANKFDLWIQLALSRLLLISFLRGVSLEDWRALVSKLTGTVAGWRLYGSPAGCNVWPYFFITWTVYRLPAINPLSWTGTSRFEIYTFFRWLILENVNIVSLWRHLSESLVDWLTVVDALFRWTTRAWGSTTIHWLA